MRPDPLHEAKRWLTQSQRDVSDAEFSGDRDHFIEERVGLAIDDARRRGPRLGRRRRADAAEQSKGEQGLGSWHGSSRRGRMQRSRHEGCCANLPTIVHAWRHGEAQAGSPVAGLGERLPYRRPSISTTLSSWERLV